MHTNLYREARLLHDWIESFSSGAKKAAGYVGEKAEAGAEAAKKGYEAAKPYAKRAGKEMYETTKATGEKLGALSSKVVDSAVNTFNDTINTLSLPSLDELKQKLGDSAGAAERKLKEMSQRALQSLQEQYRKLGSVEAQQEFAKKLETRLANDPQLCAKLRSLLDVAGEISPTLRKGVEDATLVERAKDGDKAAIELLKQRGTKDMGKMKKIGVGLAEWWDKDAVDREVTREATKQYNRELNDLCTKYPFLTPGSVQFVIRSYDRHKV